MAKAKIEQGILQLDRKRTLDIRVSPNTLDRAIRIMDALISASETQGHAWKVTEDGKTAITVNEETFHLSLHEKINRQELPPPPPPPRPKHPAAAWRPQINLLFHSQPRYAWTSTGRLTISLDGVGLRGLPQKNWNDTERNPLESTLTSSRCSQPCKQRVSPKRMLKNAPKHQRLLVADEPVDIAPPGVPLQNHRQHPNETAIKSAKNKKPATPSS